MPDAAWQTAVRPGKRGDAELSSGKSGRHVIHQVDTRRDVTRFCSRRDNRMPIQLLHRIIRFLAGLDPIQQELEAVYERRLAAMVSAQVDELQKLVTEEERLSGRLRNHLRQRKGILDRAKRAGYPADNLRVLLQHLGDFVANGAPDNTEATIDSDQYRQTVAWMQRIEHRSWKLRRDSWTNWHVVRRACREFTAMRNLIANCGERLAAEGHEQQTASCGGALIDASI